MTDQRAFRARKDTYIKTLEKQVKDAEALELNYKGLQAENYQLRDYIINLQSRLIESQGDYPQPPANINLGNPRAEDMDAHMTGPAVSVPTAPMGPASSAVVVTTAPTTTTTAETQLQASAAQAQAVVAKVKQQQQPQGSGPGQVQDDAAAAAAQLVGSGFSTATVPAERVHPNNKTNTDLTMTNGNTAVKGGAGVDTKVRMA